MKTDTARKMMSSKISTGSASMKALAAVCTMAIAFTPLMAAAQSKPSARAPEAAPSAPPASPPAAQQSWAVSCAAAGRAGVLNCAAEQKLIAQETGQTTSGVSVRVPGDSRQPALVFLFPFGLYLPAGLKAQVDQGQATDLVVQTCEPTGCFAVAPSSESLLASMTAGKTLEVRGVTMNKEPFRVTHPLSGFKAALDAIK
jgi:invasion protein IalB